MSGLHEYPIPPSLCPYCGHHFNAANETYEGETEPKPGDYSVCIECAGILRYGEKMEPLPVTEEEIEALPPAPRLLIRRSEAAIRLMHHLNEGLFKKPERSN